jgi:hypothetical protein
MLLYQCRDNQHKGLTMNKLIAIGFYLVAGYMVACYAIEFIQTNVTNIIAR